MTDIQVKLTEFSDLITRYTADFVGREWLVKQVQAMLDEPDCRFVVITGGPGPCTQAAKRMRLLPWLIIGDVRIIAH
jgi:hypothetical protein